MSERPDLMYILVRHRHAELREVMVGDRRRAPRPPAWVARRLRRLLAGEG